MKKILKELQRLKILNYNMESDEGISDDAFKELLSVVSDFYDNQNCINRLKVLYSDHIETRCDLYKASKTIELLHLLNSSDDLSPTDLTILYDTIKITGHFKLAKDIRVHIPSCPNVKDIKISNFKTYRQKLMKLGKVLAPDDVEIISGRYNSPAKNYEDSWCLIMDLERRKIICDGKMEKFTKDMNTLKILCAVECLKEDISKTSLSSESGCSEAVHLRMNRKRKSRNNESEDEPSQKDPLISLENTVDNQGDQTSDCISRNLEIKLVQSQLDNISVKIILVSRGSLIFYVSVCDANALENLYNISVSGELIQDLAKELVPADLQEEFIDRWSTDIDKEEYEAALSRLKANVKCGPYDFCIISNDAEWENMLMDGLKQTRPDLNCAIMKRWRLDKPETIKLLIGQSKNVIVGFSPKPLADYSKYAAHSVVVEMLEAKTLDDDKIIPFKILEDAVVPPEFESFTSCQVWDKLFVDRLLQDKCEPQVEISEENTEASIDNLADMVAKDSNEVQSNLYDCCILSDNSEWKNKLMEEFQERMPGIKCTSMQDLSDINKIHLITKIEKSKKVILGFSTERANVDPKSAANVVEKMLKENILHHAKLIPVKISEDASIPSNFMLFTAANGWEDHFIEKLLQSFGNDYEWWDVDWKRRLPGLYDSTMTIYSGSSGYGSSLSLASTEQYAPFTMNIPDVTTNNGINIVRLNLFITTESKTKLKKIANITWYKGESREKGIVLTSLKDSKSRRRYQTVFGKKNICHLSIKDVTAEDAGKYYCEVKVDGRKWPYECAGSLKVEGRLLSISDEHVKAIQGEDADLCFKLLKPQLKFDYFAFYKMSSGTLEEVAGSNNFFNFGYKTQYLTAKQQFILTISKVKYSQAGAYMCKCFIKNRVDKESVGYSSTTTYLSVNKNAMDATIVTMEIISEISGLIGDRVSMIGGLLGFSKGEVENIEHKYQSDLQRQNYELLHMWMEKKGVRATKKKLAKVLVDIGRAQLAEHLWPKQVFIPVESSSSLDYFWKRRQSNEMFFKFDTVTNAIRHKDWTLDSNWQELNTYVRETDHGDFKEFFSACFILKMLLPQFEPLKNFQSSKVNSNLEVDHYSNSLTNSDLQSHNAIRVTVNGNCLFSAASIIAFGSDDHCYELRLRTVIELCSEKEYYLKQEALIQCMKAEYELTRMEEDDILNDDAIPAFYEGCVRNTLKEQFSLNGNSIQLFGLASVLGCNIQSIYPAIGDTKQSPLHVLIPPRNKDIQNPLTSYLMWSTHTELGEEEVFLPNHFVPLLEK